MQSFIIWLKTASLPKLTYYINIILIKMYNQMQKLMNIYMDCCYLNLLSQNEHQINANTTAKSHLTRMINKFYTSLRL